MLVDTLSLKTLIDRLTDAIRFHFQLVFIMVVFA